MAGVLEPGGGGGVKFNFFVTLVVTRYAIIIRNMHGIPLKYKILRYIESLDLPQIDAWTDSNKRSRPAVGSVA